VLAGYRKSVHGAFDIPGDGDDPGCQARLAFPLSPGGGIDIARSDAVWQFGNLAIRQSWTARPRRMSMTGRHLSLASLFFAALPVCGQALQVSSVWVLRKRELDWRSRWIRQWEARRLLSSGKPSSQLRFWRVKVMGRRQAARRGIRVSRLSALGARPTSISAFTFATRSRSRTAQIAIVHFKIQPEAHAGTTNVRVERAAAVTADLKQLTLKEAEGTVTIH
jgi:hypothetical protein